MKTSKPLSIAVGVVGLGILGTAVSCSNVRHASAISQPVEPTVAVQSFAPQKYVLQNDFTLLWKTHSDLTPDSARVNALIQDMAVMSDAGGDLITQKFTVAQALSIQAGVLAKETALDTQREQVVAQQTALTAQKAGLETKDTDLNAQLDAVKAQLSDLTTKSTAETDPSKKKVLDSEIAQDEATEAQLEAGIAQVEGGIPQIDAGLTKIAAGLAQLDGGLEQIAAAKVKITATLTTASQAIAADRTQKIPAVTDDFSEPTALTLDFDKSGSPTVDLQGWSAEGGSPTDYSSAAGQVTNVSYKAEGGEFQFTIPLPGGVRYAFVLSRARYDLEAQGIVAFHADITRSQQGAADRQGIGKFMGAMSP